MTGLFEHYPEMFCKSAYLWLPIVLRHAIVREPKARKCAGNLLLVAMAHFSRHTNIVHPMLEVDIRDACVCVRVCTSFTDTLSSDVYLTCRVGWLRKRHLRIFR
jgi:hypothetical protein